MRLLSHDFGRSVEGCATVRELESISRFTSDGLGQAKVGELDCLVFSEQDVIWLKVSVAVALFVHMLDAMKNLLEHSLAVSLRQGTVFDDEIKQTASSGHLLDYVGNFSLAPISSDYAAVLARLNICNDVFMLAC